MTNRMLLLRFNYKKSKKLRQIGEKPATQHTPEEKKLREILGEYPEEVLCFINV